MFDNGRRGRVITGTGKRPLKSLAEMLKGKQGRFRQNLLGKRVDYSGRSVIVVGPELKLHQCGLPKKMALELFKPFLYARLAKLGLATTIKQAKRMVEKQRSEVWDSLEHIIREHPILLNRAPTLHRLGVQAFEAKLIEGNAIELHPLVCAAFNADFDGDQMAVHIPLSLEAQLEARVLMMSTNNILSPSNGKPIIVPSQDIVLGIYYLSQSKDNEKDKPQGIFLNVDEINNALERKLISLHSKIISQFSTVDKDGKKIIEKYQSTAGRFLLAETLPKHHKIGFSLINKLLNKKAVSEIIDTVYRYCGQKQTVIFCDSIKELGFKHAFKAGISFGKNDLIIPKTKEKLVNQTKKQIEEYEKQYQDGLITRGEKYNKVVDIWSKCTDSIANEMMKEISSAEKKYPDGRIETNSVFMMADSGARGSPAQMKQLAGMRGLIAKPSGEIIEQPIVSNFKEGLTVLEYFNSTHGARKGLADTALKTANSGYLTRRLCDVAQDLQITMKDCNSKSSIKLTEIIEGGNILVSLSDRVLGRAPSHDVKHPITGEVIIKKKKLIDELDCELIDRAGVKTINVFSVITCEAKEGSAKFVMAEILLEEKIVSIGEAIGMIAAQSIGEPGTQLTMRTFHVGGTAQIKEESSVISVNQGVLKINNKNLIEDSKNNTIVMGRNTQLSLEDDNGRQLALYKIPYGAKLYFQHGDKVGKGKKFVSGILIPCQLLQKRGE